MGNKGDKLTKESSLSAEALIDKLSPIDGITGKKMFGGHGIFHEGKMFGIIDSKGKVFFKIDDATRTYYVDKGSIQHSKMPYFSLPEDVFNEQDTLVEWAKKAIAISK